jgi:hypothetical protein
MALIGEALVLYYNYRLTSTRRDVLTTKQDLRKLGTTFANTVSPERKKSWTWDWQELVVFTLILAMSPVVTAIIWALAGN